MEMSGLGGLFKLFCVESPAFGGSWRQAPPSAHCTLHCHSTQGHNCHMSRSVTSTVNLSKKRIIIPKILLKTGCIVTLHRVTTVTCHVMSQSLVKFVTKKHHHTQNSPQDRMNCHSTRGHKCHKSRNVTKHGQFVTKAPSYPKPSPKQPAISL